MTHPSHHAAFRFQEWEYDGPSHVECVDCTSGLWDCEATACDECGETLCKPCHKGHGGKCATCHCNALDGAA